MEGLNQSKLRNFNLRVSLPDLAVSAKSQEMLQQPPGSSPEKTKEGALSKTESTITREAVVDNVEGPSFVDITAEFEDVDPSHDDVVPAAFVASEMGGFSMTYVRWHLQYYALMAIVDEYRMDLAWLQGNWSEFTTVKHKFLEKTPASPTGLAEEVAQLLRQSSLSRTFTTPSGPTGRSVTSSLRQIVGKIARKKRFNDAVMKAALWHVYKLL
ncbi:hypothetical protein PI124_g19472 [Phytophthora idaei]|nr:hypothetical protein PI125_g24794 [Phytophthora idaei]KAG3235494.1 hypothetical protein PI124_g19472 [Phytophthora idaei]